MNVQVFNKVGGGSSEQIDGNIIDLQTPSLVRLKIAPEAVRQFERHGDDLTLVLLNGQTVTIHNFFVQDDDGNRSDLVLEDDAGVLWWGQYTTPWSEFHFTEIESDTPLFPWWLLPGLGLAGLAAGSGGGGGGGSGRDETPVEKPEPPVIEINDINAVINPEDSSTAIVTGTMTVPPGTVPHTVTVTINGKNYPAEVDENGNWKVTVPVGELTSNMPIEATGTVKDPKTGETSEPSQPAKGVVPIKFTPEASTDEDQPLTGKVLNTGEDDDPFTYEIPEGGGPGNGTVTLDPNTGEYTYTPDPDFHGDDSFKVTVDDGKGGRTTVTINVTINPVPDIEDDTATTPEDTPVTIDVLENDEFEGENPTITHVGGQPIEPGGPAVPVDNGTVTLTPEGELVFTPDPDWNGETTFEYTVVTDTGTPETAKVTVTVTPVNDAPVPVDTVGDQNSQDAETDISLDVTPYFDDVDGDVLTYTAEGLPKGLTIDPSTGLITGTIDNSASQDGTDGVHTVTITATDGDGESATQTFTWTVSNPTPTANDDTVSTEEDTELTGNVLTGTENGHQADTDPDGDDLTVTGFVIDGATGPFELGEPFEIEGVGTLTLHESGEYTFQPAQDWHGTVPTVTYTISDGEGGTDTANLIITVTPVNDDPVPVDTVDNQNSEDAEADISLDVTPYFDDVDGDVLTYTSEGLPNGLTIDSSTGLITGTIDKSASQDGTDGVHTVTITATDGDGKSATQTFTWTVSNPTPTANDDTVSTEEDTELTGNVLTGTENGHQADTDPDGDALTVTEFVVEGATGPFEVGEPFEIEDVGTLTLHGNGEYTFTPVQDWNGTVPTVTYTISDGEGGTDTANLIITVTPVNDDPVIEGGNQAGTVVEAGHTDDGTVVEGTPVVSGTFFATDVDGDQLTWSVIGTPDTTYGNFNIDPDTGVWTYELNNELDATQALNEGDSVTLTYTVQVSDGAGGTSTREVTITINGTNDAPNAVADTDEVTESGVSGGGNDPTVGTPTATGNVLTNDTDVDEGEKATLKVSGVSFGDTVGTVGSGLEGVYGSLVLGDDGTYTYTLDNSKGSTQALKQGESVDEVFTYTVVDVNGATSTSTLTITVIGTNDRPEITSSEENAMGEVTEQGTDNTDAEDTVKGELSASDVDEGAELTWSIVAGEGIYGSITIDSETGEWTYTLDNKREATQKLNTGETGKETFTARVTDEFGAYREQVITVTVNGSNDVIQGEDAVVTVLEDESISGSLQDYVIDEDDTPVVISFTVDINGAGTVETFTFGDNYTSGSNLVLKDSDRNDLGTLTISENGDYTFTPAPNYAGDVPDVTYTMAESSVPDSPSVTQKLTVKITKVADEPGLEDNKTVNTNEDTAESLGLKVPEITDTGTGSSNNDYSERLGEITLTIGGNGASGVTLSTGEKVLTPVGGEITIVLTDVPGYHTTDVPESNAGNGVYHLTTAEYEALVANPTPESGDNFTVTVSVTSYEVDETGARIAEVEGASNTQVITVDVQAVTDGATLAIDGDTLTVAEDTAINISDKLIPTLVSTDANPGNDIDGSEEYWYSLTGLPVGSVVLIGETETEITSTDQVVSSTRSNSPTPPAISLTPPPDFSGEISAITVTLNTQDTDEDSNGDIETVTSSVILGLHVTPVAGDVTAADVTTPEDTAVAFLAGVAVTDTDGSEIINSVSFTVPTDWVLTTIPSVDGMTVTGGPTGDVTIAFTDMTQEAIETALDGFMITPPAHSSKDETIKLSIQTTDTHDVDSDTATVERDVKITVTPVAERTDTDSDGANGNDVTMIDDHAYTTPGKEDTWFALGQNMDDAVGGGHDLEADYWSNEDTDEFLYAVLTPTLVPTHPDDSVFETEFRFLTEDGWETRIFVGEPIWIPKKYLNTLQVKLPPDVAGTLTIEVQAGTVDYDDDAEVTDLPLDPPTQNGPGVSVAVSGKAVLSLIEFEPVADKVTMTLNARASGLEDTEIPLSIKTSSTDVSEKFNVTISGIEEGATIVYNGVEQTVMNGAVTIEGFSNTAPLTIKPPAHSNEDFKLTVRAQSVDGGSLSDWTEWRTIDVSVTGVADDAVVTLPESDYTVTEAELDGADNTVALSNLVTSVVSEDTDISEAVTLRITGLAKEFSVTGATMVMSGTGAERVWVVSAGKLSEASIVLPENYSGTVNLKVAGVTTEDDGDSLTGAPVDVKFTVTPSPEATITTRATLVEDEVTPLNLKIVHQGGDGDETLGKLYIPADYATGAKYVLYLDGMEFGSEAGLTPTEVNGVEGLDTGSYYVIDADQIDKLAAKGELNKDGDLDSLDFFYEVIDSPVDKTLPSVTVVKSGTLELDATPVTDPVEVLVDGVILADESGEFNAETGTATVTQSGSLTVNLRVDSEDTDGSERLIRVLIEGVPDGVTVDGASQLGSNTWLLVYEGDEAKSIGEGGLTVPVEFIVGSGAGNGTSPIKMTVQAQDRVDTETPAKDIEIADVSWNLVLDLDGEGPYEPPVIGTWEYNGAAGLEDTTFTLDDVIEVSTSGDTSVDYRYTVTITGLPEGTDVDGMTLTRINNVPTWTATVTVSSGGNSQEAVEGLLKSISITPPENSNDNHEGFDFNFNAKLTAAAVGGTSVEKDTDADMPITPVTDEASITVTADNVGEGESRITATIDVDTGVDGTHGQIVDGKLYVQVSTTGNDGGIVSVDGEMLTSKWVGDVDGIPAGDYYIIEVGESGGSVKVVYTAAGDSVLQPGDVTFTVHAQTQETGADNVKSASASRTADVEIINNGVTVAFEGVEGLETATSEKGKAIELTGLEVTLNDDKEAIKSILLSGVPVGFLLYTGESEDDASIATQQASNAGGDGITNTWVIAPDGKMPAYVAILPPPHWSGTLGGLALVVESGEEGLPPLVETHTLDNNVVVNAVADGLTIDPTLSFGKEGEIISLNLNASMVDSGEVIAAGDESTETTTLVLTGLGQFASFYVEGEEGMVLLDGSRVSYDADADAYTLTGLTQDDLYTLGFMQAEVALTDQNAADGLQIKVEAWTVESDSNAARSETVEGFVTLNVSNQRPTTGDDILIWTGAKIDGLRGDDTVQIRYGEGLSGEDLAAQLSNIEVIDLSIAGANAITDLTAAQVRTIVGVDNGTLTIKGGTESGVDGDSLSLSGDWVYGGEADGVLTFTSQLSESNTITLKVEGYVNVNEEGITEAAGTDSSSFSTFSTNLDDSSFAAFGLAHLESDETDADDDFLFGHDDDQPELSLVLQSSGSDDLDESWLAESLTDTGSAAVDASDAAASIDPYDAYAPDLVSVDDDLQHDLHGGLVVG